MKNVRNILSRRLYNQCLINPLLTSPEVLVKQFGAIQAQDFAAAKWAINQRLINSSEALIDKFFDEGKIIRTHVMRPTWHFIHTDDIEWMLRLTASNVKAAMKSNEKKLGLTKDDFIKSNKLLTKILRGGKQLTRNEISVEFNKSKFKVTNSLRLIHLLMHAELDRIICSGSKKGKQFTYALFDERVNKTKSLNSAEALAELTKRYFGSHGPAMIKDFAWWSGLKMADANKGIEMNDSILVKEIINDHTYWFTENSSLTVNSSNKVLLLPNYDEYIVGYTDRKEIINKFLVKNLDLRNNVLFNNTIIIDGEVKGTWRRIFKKDKILMEINSFSKLNKKERVRISEAAEDFGNYLGKLAELTWVN